MQWLGVSMGPVAIDSTWGTVPASQTEGSCRTVNNAKYHTYHITVRALSHLLCLLIYKKYTKPICMKAMQPTDKG